METSCDRGSFLGNGCGSGMSSALKTCSACTGGSRDEGAVEGGDIPGGRRVHSDRCCFQYWKPTFTYVDDADDADDADESDDDGCEKDDI